MSTTVPAGEYVLDTTECVMSTEKSMLPTHLDIVCYRKLMSLLCRLKVISTTTAGEVLWRVR